MAKHRTGHLFKRGPNYYIRWVVNGKVFSKALNDGAGKPITNHRDADEAKTKFMTSFFVADEVSVLESIAGKLVGRRDELTRLEEEKNPFLSISGAWQEYLTAPNRPDTGESTLEQYEFQFGQFSRWIEQKHADIQTLRAVTKVIAEEYSSHLIAAGKKAGTYNKHLNLLMLVFRILKDRARLDGNPWTEIQRKRVISQGRRELSVEELKITCSQTKGEMRTLFALGIYTGMRLGDCATLRWGEVDLLRGNIRRIPNKTARRNPKPVFVPIHAVLVALFLDTLPADRKGYVLPKLAKEYVQGSDRVTDQVQKHFESCGIICHKPGTGGKTGKRAVVEVGFHSLRHSFVSICRENDVPLSVVEAIVGHGNPAMTRLYTHVSEMAACQAVASLPSFIGNGTTSTDPETNNPKSANSSRIRMIAEEMTKENWEAKRNEILELTVVSP